MARFEQPGEILKRALAYPYAAPERSFLYVDAIVLELSPAELEQVETSEPAREPLLAYGANAAPEALARKLATLPAVPLPAVRAELLDFDVVYSAHISPYGAVPATLHESRGAAVPVHVLYPTAEQRALLAATEPNYELTQLTGIELRFGPEVAPLLGDAAPAAVDAFLSRHGWLSIAGAPVALAAVRATERSLAALDEPAVLERVRSRHAPELDLATFVSACVEAGGLAPLRHLPPS